MSAVFSHFGGDDFSGLNQGISGRGGRQTGMGPDLGGQQGVDGHFVLDSESDDVGQFAGALTADNFSADDHARIFGANELHQLFVGSGKVSGVTVDPFKETGMGGDPFHFTRASVIPAVPNPTSSMAVE